MPDNWLTRAQAKPVSGTIMKKVTPSVISHTAAVGLIFRCNHLHGLRNRT